MMQVVPLEPGKRKLFTNKSFYIHCTEVNCCLLFVCVNLLFCVLRDFLDENVSFLY